MQVNNNIPNNNNTSFTSIRLYGGAADTLKGVLKREEWLEFDKLIKEQKDLPVDVILFGHKNKRLYGKVIYSNGNKYEYKQKEYTQLPFFESTMGFIKKMCKKATQWSEDIKKQPDVDIEKIIEQTEL